MAKTATVSAVPDIANINRTSDVAHADYIHTLVVHEPEALEGLVDPSTVAEVEAAIAAAGPLFESSTDKAVSKTITTKVEAAQRALSNTAELTGYAGRSFNAETFATKVAPKPGRSRLSPEEKAAKVVDNATPEQLDALAALLREKGIEL